MLQQDSLTCGLRPGEGGGTAAHTPSHSSYPSCKRLQATFKATLNPTTQSEIYVYTGSAINTQAKLVATTTYIYYVDYNTCNPNIAIRNYNNVYCLNNLGDGTVGWATCTTEKAASCWAVVGGSGCDPDVQLKSGRDGHLLRHKVPSTGGTTRSLYSEDGDNSDFCWQLSVLY